jgi:hypothetical protein
MVGEAGEAARSLEVAVHFLTRWLSIEGCGTAPRHRRCSTCSRRSSGPPKRRHSAASFELRRCLAVVGDEAKLAEPEKLTSLTDPPRGNSPEVGSNQLEQRKPEMVQRVERVLAAAAVTGQRRTSIDTFATPEV